MDEPQKDQIVLERVNKKLKRFKPILLDHVVISTIVFVITSVLSLNNEIGKLILLILIGFYINKDIFQGRSISKFIFGYQVVENKSKNVATPIQCVLRNLTIIIWPIEVIILILLQRRIGDFFARTEVVSVERLSLKKYFNVIEGFSITILLQVFLITLMFLLFLYIVIP